MKIETNTIVQDKTTMDNIIKNAIQNFTTKHPYVYIDSIKINRRDSLGLREPIISVGTIANIPLQEEY